VTNEDVDLHSTERFRGKFTFVTQESGWTSILYELHPDQYVAAGEDPNNPPKIPLLRISPDGDQLIISPVSTIPNDRFLKPKYPRLETITLEGSAHSRPQSPHEVVALLEEFPPGFIKNPDFGLGLRKPYRYIIDTVEMLPAVKHLVLSGSRETAIDADTYVLDSLQYDALVRAIDRTHSRALKLAQIDKTILTYNGLLRKLDGTKYPEQRRPYRPDTLFRVVAGQIPKLNDRDQLAALTLVKQSRRVLAERHSRRLMELQRDIELVSLERLIEKLDALMAKDTGEEQWHNLFVDNPFILTLAFGFPVIAIGDKVSVGGHTFAGTGAKIADFLVKNDLTDNLALIEIKTARTKLLGRPYRSRVFPPSHYLAGSVTQVLDQRHSLQAELNTRKVSTRLYDIEAYAVRCVVIIGTTPQEPEQKKSLELYRNNLHDVLVITFDEVLQKLRHLHKFLSPESAP
jgi:Domain of unknown function (DUF4263)